MGTAVPRTQGCLAPIDRRVSILPALYHQVKEEEKDDEEEVKVCVMNEEDSDTTVIRALVQKAGSAVKGTNPVTCSHRGKRTSTCDRSVTCLRNPAAAAAPAQ